MELICDTSFIRKHFDAFEDKHPEYALCGTFYNFIDILYSKSNLDTGKQTIDERLESLKVNILPRLNKLDIIIEEPHYEIIRDAYLPDSFKPGKTIYERVNENFLPHFSDILKFGKNIPAELKESMITYAEKAQKRKLIQMEDFKGNRELFHNKIIEEGNDPEDLSFWIEKVEELLLLMLTKYASEGRYLPSGFDLDPSRIDLKSCELFTHSLAYFLMDPEEGETNNPAQNDHIDLLTLLYVRNGRKLLMDDRKWENIIKAVGLDKKYLFPLD